MYEPLHASFWKDYHLLMTLCVCATEKLVFFQLWQWMWLAMDPSHVTTLKNNSTSYQGVHGLPHLVNNTIHLVANPFVFGSV